RRIRSLFSLADNDVSLPAVLQTECCVGYLALATFETLDRPSIRWKPPGEARRQAAGLPGLAPTLRLSSKHGRRGSRKWIERQTPHIGAMGIFPGGSPLTGLGIFDPR